MKSTADFSLIIAIIAAMASALTAILAFRSSSRANSTSDRKVDLEEHRDAIDRLKKIIEEQDRHVERVRLQLDRVQEQLAKEQDVSLVLRTQIRNLQDQIDELSRSRARLEEILTLGPNLPPKGTTTKAPPPARKDT